MDSSEWSNFSATESRTMGCQPWRDYCDAIHRLLLARWAGGSRFRRSLKTDLFDESVGNGCLNALESISDEVHGIDISPKVVESAGARNPQSKTLVGDVRNMPYDDASFGFVFSNSTIDHFATRAEIEQSIGEMARVLANQGVLILTLDNPRNPMVGLRNFLPQRPLEASGLVPYFMGVTLPMRELVAVLGGAGFRVLKQRYLMHAPRVVFLHLLRALQKLPAVSGAVLQAMLAMEAAAGFPTAGITGHFSAVLAAKE